MKKLNFNINHNNYIKTICCLCFVFVGLISPHLSYGQTAEDENILRIKLGVAANYYYGAYDQSFDMFENDRLNYQANLSIGLALNKTKSPTIFGVFGSMSFVNAKTIDLILKDQEYTLTGVNAGVAQPHINNAYQAEVGLRLGNVLRLSTGAGRQYFDERTIVNQKNGEIKTVKYLDFYSSTVGLQIGKGSIGFFIDANFNYGLDFNNTTLKPIAGLQLQF